MQENYVELVELADFICWGHLFLNTNYGSFVFRALSIQEKMVAKYIYENAIRDAEKIGLKSKVALTVEAKMLGIWNEEHEKRLIELNNEKAEIELEIKKTKQKSKIDKLAKRLSFITSIAAPFIELKHRILESPNIENYAANEKIKYIVATSCLRFPEISPMWRTFDEFQTESRLDLVMEIIRGYCQNINAALPEAKIREIARSGYWRIKWSAAKSGGGISSLFSNSSSDMTNDQIKLIYWSQLYDSVYDSPDRPSDDVIADDTKLDEWITEKTKEAEQRRKNDSLTKKLRTKNSKMADANELIYPVDGFYSEKCTCGKPNGYHEKVCLYGVYLYYDKASREKEISKVQKNNPDDVRVLLAREKTMLEKHGTIEEQKLRNDPRTRAMLGMNTKTVNSRGQ